MPATSRQAAARVGLEPTDDPPPLPRAVGGRSPPSAIRALTGEFVAEVGVGIVHHGDPAPPRSLDPAVVTLHRRIKERFDPRGRLNPGVDVLAA